MPLSRISLFVNTLGGGGAERVTINLARAFGDKGIKTDLVVMRAKGEYANELPRNIRLVNLNAHRAIASLPKLIHYLKRERPTVLVSILDSANMISLWARLITLTRTKIVVSVATSPGDRIYAIDWRGRMLKNLLRWFYPWADAVLAKSEGVRKEVVSVFKVPRKKVYLVPNPVITPEVLAKADEPLDHPWFQPGQPPVILGVGRLNRVKDFATLLRSFAIIRQKMDARLVILGEGVDRPELEAILEKLDIKNDVLLPGFVSNPIKYMKRAKIFVLSSKAEPFGLVLVEALACGCPVVSTSCEGPTHILESGRWGKLVPTRDPNALAAAIEETLYAPNGTGIERALHFTINRSAESFLHILNNLCDPTSL